MDIFFYYSYEKPALFFWINFELKRKKIANFLNMYGIVMLDFDSFRFKTGNKSMWRASFTLKFLNLFDLSIYIKAF